MPYAYIYLLGYKHYINSKYMNKVGDDGIIVCVYKKKNMYINT